MTWTTDEYLKKQHEWQIEVAGLIRRMGIDSKVHIDSFKLARALLDYLWFYAFQQNGLTFMSAPNIANITNVIKGGES